MGVKVIFFHLFTAIVAVNLIFADETERFFGLPFFGGNSDGNNSSPLSGFFGNGLPSFFNFPSRQKRSHDNHPGDPRPRPEFHHDRGSFLSLVRCNYTEQRFRTCSNCSHALLCFPWNSGIARNCSALNLTCNNGLCVRNSTGCSSDSA